MTIAGLPAGGGQPPVQLRGRDPQGRACWAWCPRRTCPTTPSSTNCAISRPALRRRRTSRFMVRRRACPSAPICCSACRQHAGIRTWASKSARTFGCPCPPGVAHALAGATVHRQPLAPATSWSARRDYRRELLAKPVRAVWCAAYVYADAGPGRVHAWMSVFAGHDLIYENGEQPGGVRAALTNGLIFADVDVAYLALERRAHQRPSAKPPGRSLRDGSVLPSRMEALELRPLHRRRCPSCPTTPADRDRALPRRSLRIQAHGLARRLAPHARAKARWWACPAGWIPRWRCSCAARALRLAGLDASAASPP